MTRNSPLLKLENVTKRYAAPEDGGAAPDVLRGIDLELTTGESLAIVGPSGSGKSTLLNIIGTLDQPTNGTVLLGGRQLGALSDGQQAELRSREIGFVFQSHHLLPQCTVLENVLVPTLVVRAGAARSGADARAKSLLERVGLSERLTHRPGQLSGGERQRVAVVRALINEPKLLLADEPTGSLDRAAADNLAELLVELNKETGVTLILVTHALDLAGRMARVQELRDGVLQDRGV
ncbi:MAG: ABC transporter [Armatimonadetes bacterium CG_4_10_14_3_um_filter_66_18]|nr:ABC transporter ATP-binding protein [Armatimonadota bacterium]OIP07321.1 MAG: ABC transporter [Armatimonadetes bacterium CG2_30_66_41]PIU95409.1 MAG: ABC transporter [Armatimonadetes bacterium CG06_land_8_20_14_3_00_66_21]PIX43568.1 MAG: ABC transporter [Armatimonadetes bacterium CG_4_8_14_3_um_filter_66_20]PIY50384.1 MAG: ABC transporter [Armatimonadetes bacterium CG_4_10_14_3_um_filter_66_18]PIZ36596.1 MAG: ABC transporter [Armatimonadetes bacterium CG_4_10_14_0_8_um_filter_66_14]PJB7512